jgi:hypothetical protein
MLDLVGAIVGMMAIGINLVALTSVLPGPLTQRGAAEISANGGLRNLAMCSDMMVISWCHVEGCYM